MSAEETHIELTSGTKSPFNRILIEAIDDALSSLSESAKESIYYHLEKTFGIKKYEIPDRIDDFQDALEKIFGIGAKPLEIMFVKYLHNRIGVVCKWDLPKTVMPELAFKQSVLFVKQSFEAVNDGKLVMGVLVSEHEELQK